MKATEHIDLQQIVGTQQALQNANALACYGLADYGYHKLAIEIATRVTAALASDLRATGTWHEAYSTADRGTPLAGPGFLSWDTLGASLLSNLRSRVNPFRLQATL